MKDFTFDFGIKSAAETADGLTIEGYATTWEEDRDGEIVDRKSATETFQRFLDTNPVILYEHGKDMHVGRKALGHVTDYRIDDIGVWVKAFIDKPASDLLLDVYNKVKSGTLRAFSISGRWLTRGKHIILKELYELTVCAVPANPSSLFAVAAKSLNLPDAELEENCASGDAQEKAGRMLSQANMDAMSGAVDEMQAAMTRLLALLARASNAN